MIKTINRDLDNNPVSVTYLYKREVYGKDGEIKEEQVERTYPWKLTPIYLENSNEV